MDEVASVILGGTSAWDIAARLFALWRERDGGRPPNKISDTDVVDAWHLLGDEVDRALGHGELVGDPVVDGESLWAALSPHLSDLLTTYQVAHAIAYGIDEARHASFSRSWLEGRPPDFALVPGELFPVRDAPFTMEGASFGAHPYRQGWGDTELPHIRVARESQWEVVFHQAHYQTVDELSDGSIRVAVVLPNETKEEFKVVADPATSAVAVVQADPATQDDELVRLVEQAGADADLIILPELVASSAVWPALAAKLGSATRATFLVPGSFHDDSSGQRFNVSGIMVSGFGLVTEHRKFEPFTARGHGREGIAIEDPRRLHILLGERVRMAVLICKDALSPGAVEELAHAGVNLLLVPAMSDRIDEFESAAWILRRYAQGCMVVANTPRCPIEGEEVPHGLIGQPLRRDPTVEAWAPTSAPGYSLFLFGAGAAAYEPLA